MGVAQRSLKPNLIYISHLNELELGKVHDFLLQLAETRLPILADFLPQIPKLIEAKLPSVDSGFVDHHADYHQKAYNAFLKAADHDPIYTLIPQLLKLLDGLRSGDFCAEEALQSHVGINKIRADGMWSLQCMRNEALRLNDCGVRRDRTNAAMGTWESFFRPQWR